MKIIRIDKINGEREEIFKNDLMYELGFNFVNDKLDCRYEYLRRDNERIMQVVNEFLQNNSNFNSILTSPNNQAKYIKE